MEFALVAVMSLVASTLSGVTGFGGSMIMLPVLSYVYGVRIAVPILTVAQLYGNLSRAFFGRRQLDWKLVGWFSLGSVPASALGARVFASAPTEVLYKVLGVFLLLMVVFRHANQGEPRLTRYHFIPLGIVFGFLSAVLGGIGPIMAPFFLGYGLVKAGYVATEALSASIMHLTKTVAYSKYQLITMQSFGIGSGIGMVMIFGSYMGKRLLDKLSDKWFRLIIEGVMVVVGILFLLQS